MLTEADTTTTTPDARLLALLAESRDAEDAHTAAARRDDDEAIAAATDRLEAILSDMAGTPAAGWQGIAAKAARLCRSLADGDGRGVLLADGPIAESLAADLARLAPEAVRAAG